MLLARFRKAEKECSRRDILEDKATLALPHDVRKLETELSDSARRRPLAVSLRAGIDGRGAGGVLWKQRLDGTPPSSPKRTQSPTRLEGPKSRRQELSRIPNLLGEGFHDTKVRCQRRPTCS